VLLAGRQRGQRAHRAPRLLASARALATLGGQRRRGTNRGIQPIQDQLRDLP
jgi:hypothetical protein